MRFEHQASDARRLIETRIHSYAHVLYGVKALFDVHWPVTRGQFRDYVRSLDLKNRYPGFEVVNFATYVPAADKQRFEEAVRRDISLDPRGYPSFKIKPPGERPEYHVIIYLEPMAGNEFAFGLDLSDNPEVKKPQELAQAQRSARDSGELTTSGLPIHIKKEGKQFIGLAMRLAVYKPGMPLNSVEERREAYLGSVGAGFHVANLMGGVIDQLTMKYMRMALYDVGPSAQPSSGAVTPPAVERLLYDSSQTVVGSIPPSGSLDETLTTVHPMEVGGRVWHIRFTASKTAVFDPIERLLPFTVLAFGLLSSLLLFGILRSLSTSRSRAMRLAEQMTKDLRDSEERFRAIAENAFDMISVMDADGRRLYLNPAHGRLWSDYKSMIGQLAFDNSIHPEDRERAHAAFRETARDGKDRHDAYRVILPGGEVRHIEVNRSAVKDAQGRVALVVTVKRDVTERRQKDEALRAREVQLQQAQAIAKLGHWESDLVAGTQEWSDQVLRNLGLGATEQPLSREYFLSMVHPEDRAALIAATDRAQEEGSIFEHQFRIVRPDGEERIMFSRARIDRDESGRAVRMLGVSQDITERLRAEEQAASELRRYASRLRAVSRRVVEVQEAERRVLAQELHDRAGQSLTALGINLTMVANTVRRYASKELTARLEDCMTLLTETVDSVRDVLRGLRPLILDDYGLIPALRSLTTRFSRRTGIRVSCVAKDAAGDLPKPVALAMFRIAQEALNNMAKHSKARRGEVAFSIVRGVAILDVSDDGVGFEPRGANLPAPDSGWGLAIMQERAEAVGAKLSVEAGEGGGVVLRVEYRLSAETRDRAAA